MKVRLFLMAMLSSISVYGTFVNASSVDCAQTASSGLIGIEVGEVTPWLDAILENQNSSSRLAPAVVVNHAFDSGALNGKYGTSAFEALQSIAQYTKVIDLRVSNDASVNGKIVDTEKKRALDAKLKLLRDTKAAVGRVVDALNGFIDTEQKRPKNEKDQLNYDKKLDAKAADVLKTIYEAFDVANSRDSFLSDKLNAIMLLEQP